MGARPRTGDPRGRPGTHLRALRQGRRRRHPDGAGLGLAIVKAIAEAHHGRVELASAPGRGARFTVVLPAEGGAGP
jgi:two-component system OmpR family sensor kinase